MRSILMLLNLMVFVAVCTMLFFKSGAGEQLIKKAAKGAVTEIVKEEIKKQLPELPDTKWWDKK